MKKLIRNTLITSAWILPVLAFPSEDDGLYPHHRAADFSLWFRSEREPRFSYTEYSGCYAPAPLCFSYSRPADLFVQTGSTYEIGPHWKFWFIWVGGTFAITAYVCNGTKKKGCNGDNTQE